MSLIPVLSETPVPVPPLNFFIVLTPEAPTRSQFHPRYCPTPKTHHRPTPLLLQMNETFPPSPFFVVDEKAAGSRPTKAGRDKDSQEKKAAKKKAKKAKEIEKTKDEGTSYPSLDRYVRSKNLVPATAYFSIDLGLGSFHFVFVSNWRRNRTECGTRLFSLYEHYSLSLSLSCLHRFFERVRKTEDPG